MPAFTPDERLRLSRLAHELQTYGIVQYMERRQLEASFELLKVRFFAGELTDTQYWTHHAALIEVGLRQYARFHDGCWRRETYYGEATLDKLNAEAFDVADLQPADGQTELRVPGPLVE